jgi:hypothetical protein
LDLPLSFCGLMLVDPHNTQSTRHKDPTTRLYMPRTRNPLSPSRILLSPSIAYIYQEILPKLPIKQRVLSTKIHVHDTIYLI